MGETMMKDDITTLEDGGFPLTEAQIIKFTYICGMLCQKSCLILWGPLFFLSVAQWCDGWNRCPRTGDLEGEEEKDEQKIKELTKTYIYMYSKNAQ